MYKRSADMKGSCKRVKQTIPDRTQNGGAAGLYLSEMITNFHLKKLRYEIFHNRMVRALVNTVTICEFH
jgi:hypothetical protein